MRALSVMRTGVSLAAAVALFTIVVVHADANADVTIGGPSFRVDVRAVAGPDGDHGIIIEPFRERGGRNGWRARADRFGRPAFAGVGSECETNLLLNDVVCTGRRQAASIIGGDGADTVAVREIPAGTYIQPEESVVFLIGSVTRTLPVGPPNTPDPVFDCDPLLQNPESVAVTVDLGAGDDFFVVAEEALCPLGSTLVAGIDAGVNVDGGAGNDAIRGGSRADELVGGTGNDRLEGEGGNDVLNGGAGSDALFGGSGNDRVNGGAGSDELFGGSGNDSLFGGPGTDTLVGGNGNDVLDGGSGLDSLSGGSGDDLINARDAEFDEISCGSGNDIATGDLVDFLTGGPTIFRRNQNGRDCENLNIQALDDGLPGHALGQRLRRAADGSARVRVACPRAARVACRGMLTARIGRPNGRVVARARYMAPLGRQTSVRVRLGTVPRGAKVFVHTVEQGVSKKGPRRSQRLLEVT